MMNARGTSWGSSMATSSALQLADLALVWSGTSADLAMIDSDLASDAGLETAVLLSLFTDRRAEDDDEPPSGDPNDRRGWWADQFAVVEGDLFGSRLWLLDRSKRTNDAVLRAKQYGAEALQWMIDDDVAESVEVNAETTATALYIQVIVKRPGRDAVQMRFAHVWNTEA